MSIYINLTENDVDVTVNGKTTNVPASGVVCRISNAGTRTAVGIADSGNTIYFGSCLFKVIDNFPMPHDSEAITYIITDEVYDFANRIGRKTECDVIPVSKANAVPVEA